MPMRDKWSSLVTACVVWVVISAACSAEAADPPTCKSDLPNTKVSGGIVNATARKSWQPRGGEFTFVIETPTSIPNDALITVCFGWKQAGKPTDPKGFMASRPTRIVKLEPDKKIITIAATVPDLLPAPARFRGDAETAKDDRDGKLGVYRGFWIVPVADVRILLYQPSGEVVVDVLTTVGITRVPWAVFGAFAAAAIAFLLLYCCSRIRQPQLAGANPLLQIIATERNYASLSQAQIILWTLVVGASAVYVMVLSGDLIEITGSTLVLLGIAGTATVVTKWKSAIDDQKRRGAAPPAGAPAAGATGAGATGAGGAGAGTTEAGATCTPKGTTRVVGPRHQPGKGRRSRRPNDRRHARADAVLHTDHSRFRRPEDRHQL